MPSNHLILCRPLLLPTSIFPSIRVFSNESVLCVRWPKYWSFSFSISSSNEYSGLISFRMDWLDLLAVQGTLKSLLQHHSSKASIFQRSAFFIVQLSHPYKTTGKITVTGKVVHWFGQRQSITEVRTGRSSLRESTHTKPGLFWVAGQCLVFFLPRKERMCVCVCVCAIPFQITHDRVDLGI